MAEYDVRNDFTARTVHVRASGLFSEADCDGFYRLYSQRVSYRGRRHMVLADLRGMKPMPPKLAEYFGGLIAATRREGVVICAHISDHTVQRLQLARVTRENSTSDDITVDVDSLEEAHRVLSEARVRLDDPRYSAAPSIRNAISVR